MNENHSVVLFTIFFSRHVWLPREKTPDSFIEETKNENDTFERDHFETLNYSPISNHILDRTRHSFLERSSTPLSNTSSSSRYFTLSIKR